MRVNAPVAAATLNRYHGLRGVIRPMESHLDQRLQTHRDFRSELIHVHVVLDLVHQDVSRRNIYTVRSVEGASSKRQLRFYVHA